MSAIFPYPFPRLKKPQVSAGKFRGSGCQKYLRRDCVFVGFFLRYLESTSNREKHSEQEPFSMSRCLEIDERSGRAEQLISPARKFIICGKDNAGRYRHTNQKNCYWH